MKISKDMLAIGSAVLLATLMMTTKVFAADATLIVTGNTTNMENTPGWMFNRDITTATPFVFNSDAQSIGLGSLYVQPIQNTFPVVGKAGNDKFIAENFINAPIADVNTISYDFKIGAGGTDLKKDHFYMSVYANFGESPDDKFYDCRYSVVPTTGSTSGFTTVTFDPTQSYPVAKRGDSPFNCPAIPADMDDSSEGSTIRVYSLNVGDTSMSDTGLDGYFDNIVVNRDSGVSTYDFEPAITPTSKDDCKKDNWMNFNTPVFKNQGSCVSFVQSNSSQK